MFALLGGVAAWVAFLSWGFEGGRYPTWQVAAAGLALVAVVFALTVRRGTWWATTLGLTVGFTAAWTWWASRDDETGMFVVGALMVAAGVFVGALVVTGVVGAVRRGR